MTRPVKLILIIFIIILLIPIVNYHLNQYKNKVKYPQKIEIYDKGKLIESVVASEELCIMLDDTVFYIFPADLDKTYKRMYKIRNFNHFDNTYAFDIKDVTIEINPRYHD